MGSTKSEMGLGMVQNNYNYSGIKFFDIWRCYVATAFESIMFATKDDLKQLEKKIMSALDELKTAVDALTTSVNTLTTNQVAADTAIQAEIKALQDAMVAGNMEGVHTAAMAISDLSSKVGASAQDIADHTAALTASLNPAPGP
jgi:uncharacterized protein YlxW (UPF0749 family)